jgi:ribosomal protein RSM22 (predicted rRNA methylase)
MAAQDWCHFSERLPRLKRHRIFKGAELNYEDEKYSYLIVSKDPSSGESQARIVKRPIKRSGHVVLDVCEGGKLHRLTVSKKESHYLKAKKAQWGDLLPNK